MGPLLQVEGWGCAPEARHMHTGCMLLGLPGAFIIVCHPGVGVARFQGNVVSHCVTHQDILTYHSLHTPG